MMAALVAVLVILLWVAAVAFGRDTRDGSDWVRRASVLGPTGRPGD